MGIGGCRFGVGGEEARDPGEEGDVDYHEGADVKVGEDVGDGVGDLRNVESILRSTVVSLSSSLS
jgi:hypothetical protein